MDLFWEHFIMQIKNLEPRVGAIYATVKLIISLGDFEALH